MSHIRVEVTREEDIPRLMEIVIPAFEAGPYAQLVGDTNTPENLLAAGNRHLHAWREHAKDFSQPFWIKAVHTDPTTGKETIVASAEWVIYERSRTEAEFTRPNYLLSAAWVTDADKKAEAAGMFKSLQEKRIKWFAGKPHALLLYMATDPAFQRRGAASACVQWGLDRCGELGIPAYLEASEAGAPVYERLGFRTCDSVVVGGEGNDIMIWWPENVGLEERKPVSSFQVVDRNGDSSLTS